MDFNERCPICGCIIGYYINSYGRVVKQCNNCKHIIANRCVATNKTTVTQSTTTNTPLSNNLSKD
nr:MAG TPA: TFIIB zinc-binding [Caudoviricetes sp.]